MYSIYLMGEEIEIHYSMATKSIPHIFWNIYIIFPTSVRSNSMFDVQTF